MRAIGYIRVSTEEQARDGVSLEAQREKIRLYCELHSLELVGVEVDAGVSAKTLDRPGLESALSMLAFDQADGLVVAKLDRLSRSIGDWQQLIERHFGERGSSLLWSVGDSIDTRTAAGRMVLNMLMTVAQWEREVITERTRDALSHKRSRGERVGRVPFGKRLDADGVHLVDSADDADALEAARQMRAEGLSIRAIARALSGLYPTRSGNPWAPSTVHKILKGGAACASSASN